MRSSRYWLLTLVISCLVATGCSRPFVRISKTQYVDKCKGAWAGQMIGVCYGAPYEFHAVAKIIEEDMRPWTPERVAGAIGQDDCYVEMTWLAALEQHGLDITYEQAGRAFGDSQYGLAHANRSGRDNIRRGVMPPWSGHPKYNRHADDIDFQIEADLIGIICPAMPGESNRLGDVFGRVMNYGDGLYGGLFIAGMYTAAYSESDDFRKVVAAGLACIPEKSLYYQCIADVLAWHAEEPRDWKAVWKKLEAKWQDDVDCFPHYGFNIDAKINGAYVVMGLLYGEGDMLKTMDIATRCGQDSDCNASSAAGVLGCMKGYASLDQSLIGGIAAIQDKNFSHTNYSFKTLIPACQAMSERIIRRAGGTVEADAYLIPLRKPSRPKLEQWDDQMNTLAEVLTQDEMDLWNPKWRLVASSFQMDPGWKYDEWGRKNVILIHPLDRARPAAIAAELDVPATASPKLVLDVLSAKQGDWLLRVFINDKPLLEQVVDSKEQWVTHTVDLTPYAGQQVKARVENALHTDTFFSGGYFNRVGVEP